MDAGITQDLLFFPFLLTLSLPNCLYFLYFNNVHLLPLQYKTPFKNIKALLMSMCGNNGKTLNITCSLCLMTAQSIRGAQ